MNLKRYRYILCLTLIAFLLHTVEEYITKLYKVDHFIFWVSDHFSVNAISIYLVIQALVIMLVLILLYEATRNKFNKTLAIMLGLVFILELLHPYQSIGSAGYYPGLYSGMALVILGYFYWKELIGNNLLKFKKKSFRRFGFVILNAEKDVNYDNLVMNDLTRLLVFVAHEGKYPIGTVLLVDAEDSNTTIEQIIEVFTQNNLKVRQIDPKIIKE